MRSEALRAGLLILLVLLAVACGRGVREPSDGPPTGRFDTSRIVQPEPRAEPRSPYGNHSPYEVLGRSYRVMASAEGYRETGIASWYGTKFHGRLTSSGEAYDMYRLTAAHKTLPLPTWAEVRHLGNGRSIIVRINDRGPFHPDRIIDLSWAAAVQLGIDQSGTGPVEVTAISFDEPIVAATRPARLPVLLQVGAFGERQRADAVVERLERAGLVPVTSRRARTGAGRVWRVQIGPLASADDAIGMVERVIALGYGRPQYVYFENSDQQ